MIDPNKPSWTLRRLAIFGMFGMCTIILLYITFNGQDNGLHNTIFVWTISSMLALVLGYTGIASIEDVKLANILGKK